MHSSAEALTTGWWCHRLPSNRGIDPLIVIKICNAICILFSFANIVALHFYVSQDTFLNKNPYTSPLYSFVFFLKTEMLLFIKCSLEKWIIITFICRYQVSIVMKFKIREPQMELIMVIINIVWVYRSKWFYDFLYICCLLCIIFILAIDKNMTDFYKPLARSIHSSIPRRIYFFLQRVRCRH
jgi:hypothetical protein